MVLFKKAIIKLPIVITIVILPFLLEVFSQYIYNLIKKEKTEITFCLDGWIMIGSSEFDDLKNVKLLCDEFPARNIVKVSWRIINSGDKGISAFERGPLIIYPHELQLVSARISECSKDLKVNKIIKTDNDTARVDSLGIFNRGDYFKIDFYFKDVNESSINKNLFSVWNLEGKALDLFISKDTSIFSQENKNTNNFPPMLWILYFSLLVIIVINVFYVSLVKKGIKRRAKGKKEINRHTKRK